MFLTLNNIKYDDDGDYRDDNNNKDNKLLIH